MIQTGYDLPLALSVCGALGGGDRRRARAGVHGERTLRFGFRSKWLSDDDPLFPCDRVRAGQALVLPAGELADPHLGSRLGEDRVQLRSARQVVEHRFRGYGRDAAEEARYAPEEILPLCRTAGDGEADCLFGAARTIANAWGSVAPAAALCDAAPVEAREACFLAGLCSGCSTRMLRTRRTACARLTRNHVDACCRAVAAGGPPERPPGLGLTDETHVTVPRLASGQFSSDRAPHPG